MAVNLIERGVDGLVLVGTTHEPELLARLKAASKPYVLTWASDARGRLPCIGFDNRLATALVTQHLVDLGHTQFAVISGVVENNERVTERLAGIRDTLARNRLTLRGARIVETAFTPEAGQIAAAALLAQRNRPTAILCNNDVLAVGAISACHSRGVRVPEDVSIAGGGNFDIAPFVVPALTTVRWPTSELGRHAAQRLVDEIEGRPFRLQQTFPVELIVRESTGPCPVKQPAKV
jgi:LacI family transcriptional regulator